MEPTLLDACNVLTNLDFEEVLGLLLHPVRSPPDSSFHVDTRTPPPFLPPLRPTSHITCHIASRTATVPSTAAAALEPPVALATLASLASLYEPDAPDAPDAPDPDFLASPIANDCDATFDDVLVASYTHASGVSHALPRVENPSRPFKTRRTLGQAVRLVRCATPSHWPV